MSLKISIRAAANAPRPVRRAAGDLLMRIDTLTITAIAHTMPMPMLRIPRSGRLRVLRTAS